MAGVDFVISVVPVVDCHNNNVKNIRNTFSMTLGLSVRCNAVQIQLLGITWVPSRPFGVLEDTGLERCKSATFVPPLIPILRPKSL
jgi:hypothetical protein